MKPTVLYLLLLFLLLLSGVALFLSLWIVVPAPTFTLLPLGVGAPEISPWLFGLNAIALLFLLLSPSNHWIFTLAIVGSVAGMVLSAHPLSQVATASQRASSAMEHSLGNYLPQIPPELQAQMRPQPFALVDVFRGISTERNLAVEEIRQQSIQFAQPDGVPLFLQVYQPPQSGLYPTIVTIYGGAWQNGSPTANADFNRYMAAQGYTVVALDYRHAPQYQFPVQIDDVRLALTYLQKHARSLEADLDRLVLMGRSAGAQLAMIAAYSAALPVRSVVNYYGPVNLTIGYREPPQPDPINSRAVLEAFLGGTPDQKPALYEKASPYTYITPNMPPTLLIYGGRDHVVQAKYGRGLRDRLLAAGNTAVYIELPWSEHAFDALFSGLGNQVALYYTERFIAWSVRDE
ncbi:MAG: alpha/beta hydrolase [Oscillatoriophycideae cyanobacterium NC_groundwater_1537_Pr4_S-0.65um_50_18]|nr:alpha/beta hydrolase [Oscillatoriophycideae cyanobacterium NC_groundwater_1537_Pr4_S-0.65um_50_18]